MRYLIVSVPDHCLSFYLVRKLHTRRVEVGAKLCLRTLASTTSDKFSSIFGQYLLAGKMCFPRTSFIFGLLPLRHLSDVYHHAMKYLYTNSSLPIFSANPIIKRKT